MTIILDLKKIKLTPFDYSILEGNTKDTIVLQVYSDFPNSFVKNNKSQDILVLADTDGAIDYWKKQGLPVIAWSHENNDDESLMAASWMILEPEALTDAYLTEILCRHQGLPVTVCQTERCYLRELTMEDLVELLSLDAEQEVESAGKFFPEDLLYQKNILSDSFPEMHAQYLKDYIHTQYSFYGFGIYAAFDSARKDFLGIAGFSTYEPVENIEAPIMVCQEEAGKKAETLSVEIGYAVKKEYRQQGYAKEWIQGLTEWIQDYYGPDGVEIVARIPAGNEASIRTAKSCGIAIILQ